MAEPVLQMSAEHTADLLANMRGGSARGGHYLGKLGIAAELGFESPGGDEGGLFISAHHRDGGALDARVRVQPTLQLVRNPGGDPTVRDAVVAGVRLTLRWESP